MKANISLAHLTPFQRVVYLSNPRRHRPPVQWGVLFGWIGAGAFCLGFWALLAWCAGIL